MSGAIPPFPQYAFMAWYSVKAQGKLLLLTPKYTCFLQTLIVTLLLKKSLLSRNTSPSPQNACSVRCSKTVEDSPHLTTYFLMSILISSPNSL
jgi:hypothetical protein